LYTETQELRQFLAMWREMKQLYDTQQFDSAVSRFGADMVAHHNVADINHEMTRLEALIAERMRNGKQA
jgi:hypothetical protein